MDQRRDRACAVGKRRRRIAACCLLAWIAAPAAAQSSANYQIAGQVLNNGGGPGDTPDPSSTNYRITLHSLGEAVPVAPSGSASFQVDGSFAGAYRPPREVLNLRFQNPTTLVWDAEPSVGTYDIYRSDVSLIPDGDTGFCLASQLPEAVVYEPFSPDPGEAWFYLVTAVNRIGEKGTKGYGSDGMERPNLSQCF